MTGEFECTSTDNDQQPFDSRRAVSNVRNRSPFKRKVDDSISRAIPSQKRLKLPKPSSVFNKKPYGSEFVSTKTSLRSIVTNEETLEKLKSVVVRMHEMGVRAYAFVRLFCLHEFEQGRQLPDIMDKKLTFIKACLKTLGAKTNRGRPPASTPLMCELDGFYNMHFKESILNENKIDMKHLNYVHPYLAQEIATAIETNVKTQFLKRLRHFVNISASE